MYLKLESEVPHPVYKERGFAIRVSLRNSLNEVVTKPPTGLHFRLSVHEDYPIHKELTHNISGKRILRGTVEATTDDGFLDFPNVVLTEVSSKHASGAILLVVSPISAPEIAELRIQDVTVKARRLIKIRTQ
jgi:hypothetical protein